MTSTILAIPSEPLPTKLSANRNTHRLSKLSANVILLEPGKTELWAALLSLVFLPIVVASCLILHTSLALTIGLSLFPLFGVAGFGAGAFCYHKFGTRARFDREQRRVSVTGWRHGEGLSYPWEGIRAVQFCDSGRKLGGVHQVNLVVGTDPLWRINLLDSRGKRQLRLIADRIADFLEVPLYINSLPAHRKES
jgi:hypothetical protein